MSRVISSVSKSFSLRGIAFGLVSTLALAAPALAQAAWRMEIAIVAVD